MFDYSKAFDLVDHQILLQKLSLIGVSGEVCSWIESFLSNRTMRVRVAGELSGAAHVSSGVPQGSVLGPLLFLIYINHVVSRIDSRYMIFADDLKIYFSAETRDDINHIDILQKDIDSLVEVGNSWGLKLNHSKCAVMRFCSRSSNLPHSGVSPYKVSGNPIQFVDVHKDLGILIDRNMKFHVHIKYRVAVAGALTSNIMNFTLCRKPEFLLNIYKAHVRPLLDYASPLWNINYISDTKLLERIQRKWTRCVEGLSEVPYASALLIPRAASESRHDFDLEDYA